MSIRALAISVSTVACCLTLLPAPAFPQKPAFNLDTGIAPHEVVIPAVLPPFLATVSSSDASLVLHMTVQLNNIVNSTQGEKLYNVNMAATILTALVPLIVYFGSGRWFVRGITAGAVKG